MKNQLLNKTAISFIYRVLGILIIALVILMGIVSFAGWQSENQAVTSDDLEAQISYCESGADC